MLVHPTFTVKESKDFSSYYAGYSFGRLVCNNSAKKTELELLSLIETLKPSKSLSAFWYRRGFYTGFYNCYEQRWQSCLPLQVTKEERTHIMGKLSNIQKQVSASNEGWNGFIKARVLIDQKIPFCMREVQAAVGNFGPEWRISLVIDQAILQSLGASSDVYGAILTLARSPHGRKTSKDDILESAAQRVPVHCCSLVSIATKSGNQYIDFREVKPDFDPDGQEICPGCGEVIEQEEEDDLPSSELDDNPF